MQCNINYLTITLKYSLKILKLTIDLRIKKSKCKLTSAFLCSQCNTRMLSLEKAVFFDF